MTSHSEYVADQFVANGVDVEAPFLHGELEDEIYKECPPGMKDVRKDDRIILQ